MEIIECEKHHFYDMSLYSSCPQCEAQKQEGSTDDLGISSTSVVSRIPPRNKGGFMSFFRSKEQDPVPEEPEQEQVADYGETLAVNQGFTPDFFQDAGTGPAVPEAAGETVNESTADSFVEDYGETRAVSQGFTPDFFQDSGTGSAVPEAAGETVNEGSADSFVEDYGETRAVSQGFSDDFFENNTSGSAASDTGAGNGVEDYGETMPARRSNTPSHVSEVEDYGETQPAGFNFKENFDPLAGWLICINGPGKGKDYRLHSGYNRIGRSPQSDVFLKSDVTVSKEGSGIIAYDPRGNRFYFGGGIGRNLSYVNNEVILSQTEIFAYDVITVGSTDLLFIPLCGEHFDWNKPIENDTEETDEI